MKKSVLALGIAALAAGATVAVAQGMKPEDAIVARKAVMRVIGLNFGPMGAMVKGEISFNKDAFLASANRIESVSTMPILNYFGAGTETGGNTKAKADIWKDPEKFKSNMEKMQKEVAALAQAARSGDEAAMKKQFGEAGKACKSCHDDFREK